MVATTMQIIHAQSQRFRYMRVQQAGAFKEGAAVMRATAAGETKAVVAASRKLMQFLDRPSPGQQSIGSIKGRTNWQLPDYLRTELPMSLLHQWQRMTSTRVLNPAAPTHRKWRKTC